MPLPERRKGETREQFVKRCMGDATMIREFPRLFGKSRIKAAWKMERRQSCKDCLS